jgi:hypothetical protein
MALFSPNSLFGSTLIAIIIIFGVQFLSLRQSLKNINDKYKKLSYLIILTSFAASFILYGLALYFFIGFKHEIFGAPFLIVSTLFLITFQMISVFVTQWKIANAREQLSGGLSQTLPLYKTTSILFSIVISSLFLFIGFPLMLRYFSSNGQNNLEPNQILFASVPLIIAFSIFSAGQSFVNLKNLTNLYP